MLWPYSEYSEEPLKLAVPGASVLCLLFPSLDVYTGLKAAELYLTWNSSSRQIMGQITEWRFSSCTQGLVYLFGRGLLVKQVNFKPE